MFEDLPESTLRDSGSKVGDNIQFGTGYLTLDLKRLVMQWLAQATHNRLVAGSNPAGPIFSNIQHRGKIIWKNSQVDQETDYDIPNRSL